MLSVTSTERPGRTVTMPSTLKIWTKSTYHQMMDTIPQSSCRVGLVLLCLPFVLGFSEAAVVVTSEKDLLASLLTDYNPAARPTVSATDVLQVELQLIFLRVIELKEQHQILVTEGWLRQVWQDVQLTWDPADHGGLEHLRIPTQKIWIPDIVLYNTAEEDVYSNVIEKLAVVKYDGTVSLVPHGRWESYCSLDLRRYPFDSQKCHIYFGSWTYDMTQLNVILSKNQSKDILYIHGKQEWNSIDFSSNMNIFNLSFSTPSEEAYPTAVFTLELERDGMFLGSVYVGLAILVSLLTLLMFWVPPQAGERITLGVGSVISCSILLALLDSNLPLSMAQAPMVGIYLIFNFIMATLAIIISTAVFNFHFRGIRQEKIPDCMRRVLLGRVSRLFGIRAMPYTSIPKSESYTSQQVQEMQDTHLPLNSVDKILMEISEYLKICANKGAEEDAGMSHRQLVVNEWHQVALVVDKICFSVYLVVSVVAMLALLLA